MSFISKNFHFDQFSSIGERLHVKKGINILSLDKTEKPAVYALVKGVCCLTKLTEDGEEMNYLYFTEGQLMRIVSCMLSDFSYTRKDFEIVTKTPCIIQRIECAEFKQALRDDSKLAESVIYTLCERYSATLLDQHQQYDQPACLRLCEALLRLSVPHRNEFILNPDFTYNELAKYLKLHQITVTRIMSALKKNGVIRKDKRIVIINIKKLQRLIHDQRPFEY